MLYGRLTEPLSEEKKMIKLIKRFIVFIFLTSVLFSCSLLDSQNEASITFTIDRNMAQKISDTDRARNVSESASRSISPEEMEGLYFQINLKGGYEDSKTIPVVENASVDFENIPVGIELYAEANAYRLEEIDGIKDKIVLFEGKSEKIIVSAGNNKLSISLKRIEPVIQTSSIKLSISIDGTPDSNKIQAYEIRIRDSNNEMSQILTVDNIENPVLIENLPQDNYTISVLAYYLNVDGAEDYNDVTYYGKTSTELSASENKSANVELRDFSSSGTYICVNIQPINSAAEKWGVLGSNNKYSCTITGNGVNFTTEGLETVGNGNNYGYMTPGSWNSHKDKFLEPGFAYTFDVTVIKEGWVDNAWVDKIEEYHGSTTQIVEESNYSNQSSHEVTVVVE